VDGPLALDDAAELLLALSAGDLLRAGVALDHVQVLDVHAFLGGIDAQHATALAAILA